MIGVDDALARILSYVEVLPAVEQPLLDSLGQVLAEDIESTFDIPPLDNTAMDGYVVRFRDTASATQESPTELEVIGEVAAGYEFEGSVEPGQAVRIMTGAPVPAGADAIVPFEETDEPFDQAPSGAKKFSGRVKVLKAAKDGANIRRAAEDVASGRVIVEAGTVLRASEIGVVASLGRATVRVIRKPVVAVLSTGDELLEPGQERSGARIYDANAHSVGSLVLRYGGVPKLLGIAKDTVEALTAKVREGLSADMLITSAGVSRGDYDIVKDVLAREGEIAFWTVAMKPGKPLAFGRFTIDGKSIPHIGLPGNPVSSMVAFELFGRPAIMKMLGKKVERRSVVRAIAEEQIVNRNDPRLFLARCIVTERDGKYYASLAGSQGSGMLTSMMRANALTLIPAEVDVVAPGEEIDVIMLDWSRGEEWGSDLRTQSTP